MFILLLFANLSLDCTKAKTDEEVARCKCFYASNYGECLNTYRQLKCLEKETLTVFLNNFNNYNKMSYLSTTITKKITGGVINTTKLQDLCTLKNPAFDVFKTALTNPNKVLTSGNSHEYNLTIELPTMLYDYIIELQSSVATYDCFEKYAPSIVNLLSSIIAHRRNTTPTFFLKNQDLIKRFFSEITDFPKIQAKCEQNKEAISIN